MEDRISGCSINVECLLLPLLEAGGKCLVRNEALLSSTPLLFRPFFGLYSLDLRKNEINDDCRLLLLMPDETAAPSDLVNLSLPIDLFVISLYYHHYPLIDTSSKSPPFFLRDTTVKDCKK